MRVAREDDSKDGVAGGRASRTYHAGFPAAHWNERHFGALDPLDGGSYPTDSCIGRRDVPRRTYWHTLDTRLSPYSAALLQAKEDRGGSPRRGVL